MLGWALVGVGEALMYVAVTGLLRSIRTPEATTRAEWQRLANRVDDHPKLFWLIVLSVGVGAITGVWDVVTAKGLAKAVALVLFPTVSVTFLVIALWVWRLPTEPTSA